MCLLLKKLTIICDPLTSDLGPTRPPVLIAKELRKYDYEISLMSITINEKLQKTLDSHKIKVFSVGSKTFFKSDSLTWFYFWTREGIFESISRKMRNLKSKHEGVVLNFSNMIVLPSHIWYAQGPPTVLIDNIKDYLAPHYKMFYALTSHFLRKIDYKTTQKFSEISEKVFTNSKYLAHLYKRWGVEVNTVIYPPLDCQKFKPTTASPSEEYVVTYFGKETDFRAIQKALDNGIKIKAFGGKIATAPKVMLKHPNLAFLGRISDSQLIDLYSNALFTFFPFIEEPFGYIPIESMACGTPVITFDKQGPRETVVNKVTGWLANNEHEMIDIALRIWNEGYPKKIRSNCRQKSLEFDVSLIVKRWLSEITNI